MRILVCGSRTWSNKELLNYTLDRIVTGIGSYEYPDCIIHGAAKGADTMAGEWAHQRGIQVESFPAQWDLYGNAAGPIRNAKMLNEGKPDLVVAFTNDLENSKGTRNMVTLAEKANVDTMIIGEDNEGG